MPGDITLIIGPMHSCKTTSLLNLGKRFQLAGKKILYIKPSIDTRGKYILTHDNVEKECLVVNNLSDIDVKLINEYDVVAIDEIQFFIEAVEFCDKVANMGKKVICRGLNGDFQRNTFDVIGKLISKAENIIKLSAVCVGCGSDSSFTHRKDSNNKDLIDVGGSNKYEPLCRECFNSKNK